MTARALAPIAAMGLVVLGAHAHAATVTAAENPATPALVVRTSLDNNGWPAAEDRARAELEALGMPATAGPEEASAPNASEDERLITRLRAAGARAAVELWITARSVDGDPLAVMIHVAVAAPDGGAPKTFRAERNDGGRALAPARAGLLAAEALFALCEDVGAASRVREAGQTDRATDGPRPPTERLFAARGGSLRVALLATAAPTSTTTRPGLAIGATTYFVNRDEYQVGVDVELAASLLATDFALDGVGTAQLRFIAPRAQIIISGKPRGRLAPFVGIGGGALLSDLHGVTYAPAATQNKIAVSGLLVVEMGLAARISDAIAARIAVTAGAAVPETTLVLNQHELARFGQPLLSVTLGLEWSRRPR